MLIQSLDLPSLSPQIINLDDQKCLLGREPVAPVTGVAAILDGAPPALDELAHSLRHVELAKDVVELLGADGGQRPAVDARGLQGREAAQLAQTLAVRRKHARLDRLGREPLGDQPLGLRGGYLWEDAAALGRHGQPMEQTKEERRVTD